MGRTNHQTLSQNKPETPKRKKQEPDREGPNKDDTQDNTEAPKREEQGEARHPPDKEQHATPTIRPPTNKANWWRPGTEGHKENIKPVCNKHTRKERGRTKYGDQYNIKTERGPVKLAPQVHTGPSQRNRADIPKHKRKVTSQDPGRHHNDKTKKGLRKDTRTKLGAQQQIQPGKTKENSITTKSEESRTSGPPGHPKPNVTNNKVRP